MPQLIVYGHFNQNISFEKVPNRFKLQWFVIGLLYRRVYCFWPEFWYRLNLFCLCISYSHLRELHNSTLKGYCNYRGPQLFPWREEILFYFTWLVLLLFQVRFLKLFDVIIVVITGCYFYEVIHLLTVVVIVAVIIIAVIVFMIFTDILNKNYWIMSYS